MIRRLDEEIGSRSRRSINATTLDIPPIAMCLPVGETAEANVKLCTNVVYSARPLTALMAESVPLQQHITCLLSSVQLTLKTREYRRRATTGGLSL